MRLNVFFFISVVFLFINQLTIAQAKNEKPIKLDTISETIIYEYDTVYVAPDTLKLTDTIVNYRARQNQIKPSHNFKLFNNITIFNNISDRWSAGVGIGSFVPGLLNKGNMVDSFSTRRLVNFSFEFHVNYEVNHFKYTLGFGYTPFHEQLQYNGEKPVYSPIATNGSYDSLLVKKDCVSDNYFNYINVFFNLGRKWGRANDRTFFILTTCISGDFLINYKALFPVDESAKIVGSSVRKVGFRIGVNPCIGYKLWGNLDLTLGPFCNYSLLNNQKYPTSDRLILGAYLRVQ